MRQTTCTGFKQKLCMECKRHTKEGKVIGKIEKRPTGRKTCVKFIQR